MALAREVFNGVTICQGHAISSIISVARIKPEDIYREMFGTRHRTAHKAAWTLLDKIRLTRQGRYEKSLLETLWRPVHEIIPRGPTPRIACALFELYRDLAIGITDAALRGAKKKVDRHCSAITLCVDYPIFLRTENMLHYLMR